MLMKAELCVNGRLERISPTIEVDALPKFYTMDKEEYIIICWRSNVLKKRRYVLNVVSKE